MYLIIFDDNHEIRDKFAYFCIKAITYFFHVELTKLSFNMSHDVRKPAFCICENKDADQLRGNREADQRLCFRYTDSTIPLLPKSEIARL